MHNITNNFDIVVGSVDVFYNALQCDICEMTANVGLSVQKDLLVP